MDSVSYPCPHCGETLVSAVDVSAGSRQEYVEDCHVCCRPNLLRLTVTPGGGVTVEAVPESD
jgi:transposase-like protein